MSDKELNKSFSNLCLNSGFLASSISKSTSVTFRSGHSFEIVVGDATKPIGDGKKIIAHICNNAGAWGKGFVLAVSKSWSNPEEEYRRLLVPIDLGFVQFVQVAEDITVANMVAQTEPVSKGIPPIRYDALQVALKQVAEQAFKTGASVHMPKIGTGLSRGNWIRISYIIKKELLQLGIPVLVYVMANQGQ